VPFQRERASVTAVAFPSRPGGRDAWQEQRHSDPTWLPWVRERAAQRFFLVTLCRALYRHEHSTLASKAAAAAWAQATLEPTWSALLARSLAARDEKANVSDEELDESLAFLEYTAKRLS